MLSKDKLGFSLIMGQLISYSSRAGSHNFIIKWVHNTDERAAHWLEKTRHDGAHCFHDGVTSSEKLDRNNDMLLGNERKEAKCETYYDNGACDS
jgi:hypothetical protein